MLNKQHNNGLRVIVGLGKTGFACARFLWQQHIPFAITDSRANPPYLDQLKSEYPTIQIKVGGLDKQLINKAEELIVSPGMSLQEPLLAHRLESGVPAIGDIELFVRLANAPICAITGSNAKSTVTTMLNEMAKVAGTSVRTGGNIGTPVLDLIQADEPDLYVLELSSFQLETTCSLHAAAATVLNISPDHMDRYANLADYIAAKQQIYANAEFAIFNRDDAQTFIKPTTAKQHISFGLSKPKADEFGITNTDSGYYLAFGDEALMSVNELPLKGKHNWSNALAALALGYAMKLPMPSMLSALGQFSGLPHRCQWVGQKNGIDWYNDSKGTNVGATVSAINGLGEAISGKIVLIAGGLGKDADFKELSMPVKKHVSQVILLGEDGATIAKVLDGNVPITFVKNLVDAVKVADKHSEAGDSILLSPACASFDMFQNYEDRGNQFMDAVKELAL